MPTGAGYGPAGIAGYFFEYADPPTRGQPSCFYGPNVIRLDGFEKYTENRGMLQSLCGPHEKRLLNELLSSYNTLERPVANESEPLQVRFGITLQQIIDVRLQIQIPQAIDHVTFSSNISLNSRIDSNPSQLKRSGILGSSNLIRV
ncbi:Neuronal acetylcholine receptor subunit alpha-7 [Eufriesea mexicana]|uniref:Neuronal acetylcholine receptor subunit alpha-7 n=1 Tax=Eufriesea mexicana TaxID=516756 RepID=A0A310SFE6_9HYME|nr:Neuronal acetylcholine receptor subunit alpha-7 [Eufriesea mexicana]